jgi:hypothetical protein
MAPGEVQRCKGLRQEKEPLNTTAVVHPTGVLQVSAPQFSNVSFG